MTNYSLAERVDKMMAALGLNQPEFATIAGVTKGAVNQWLSGLTKNIDAGPAFSLQRKTGYNAEWIMFGSGPEKIAYIATAFADPKVASVVECMTRMDDYGKDAMVKISVTFAKPADDQKLSDGS